MAHDGTEKTGRRAGYDLPGDCRHSMHRYDADTHEIGYRCGVDEAGEPFLVGGDAEPRDIATDGTDCVGCPFFLDTRMRYPLTIGGIDYEDDFSDTTGCDPAGTVVLVTFMEGGERRWAMGILVGSPVVAPSVSWSADDGCLHVRGLKNPAIFVPSVGRIVWGCESWWHEATLDDLGRVVGDDAWQMGIAKALLDKEDGTPGEMAGGDGSEA